MEHRQYTNLNQNANKNMSPVISVETELLQIVGNEIETDSGQIFMKAQKLVPTIERLAKNCAFLPKKLRKNYGETKFIGVNKQFMLY